MSSTEDELDRHEAAKRATSTKPTLCPAYGNRKLPHFLTPGCLICWGLVTEWSYGREATGGVGIGQAQAEMHAALAEASGQTVPPGPISIEARIIRDSDKLDRFNPRDWPELRENWRRHRLAGFNRVPVTGPSVALIGGGVLAFALLPTSLGWIGLTVALVGLSYWLDPWWWWK